MNARTRWFLRFWRVETTPSIDLTPDERKLKRWLTLIFLVLISLVGFRIGALAYLENADQAAFYQKYFSPAVTLYCTGEFKQAEPTEALRQFLNSGEPDNELCSQVRAIPNWEPFDKTTSYLYLLTALSWVIAGLSWTSLWVAAGVLSAALALATFGFVRAFTTSTLVAAIFAFVVAESAPVEHHIPYLRDFSKAPFLVGTLAFLAMSILGRIGVRKAFVLAFAAGSVAALGRGFRPDILMVLPIALLCPLLLIWSDKKEIVLARMGAVWAGFLLGFLVLHVPYWIINADTIDGASLNSHVFLQGFAPDYLAGALSMPETDYILSIFSKDEFIMGKANLFHGYGSLWEYPELYTEIYSDSSERLFFDSLLTLPYDSFIRLFYTSNMVGDLPLNELIWGLPLLILFPILFMSNPRALLFLAGTFIILVAPQSLLPHLRHGFFLVVIGAAFIALSLFTAYRVFTLVASNGLTLSPLGKFRLRALAISVAGMAILIGATSFALSHLQKRELRSVAELYKGLSWKPLEFETSEPGVVALTSPDTQRSMLLERVDFDVSPMSEAPSIASEFSWRGMQDASLVETSEGFLLSTNRRGYAAESTLDVQALGLSEDGDRLIGISLSGRTIEGEYYVGLLSADRSKWIVRDRLPAGEWHYGRRVELPADVDSAFILFEKIGPGDGSLELSSADIKRISPDDCYTGSFSVDHVYYYYTGRDLIGRTLIHLRGDTRTSLYLTPLRNGRSLGFKHLKLSGLPAHCIAGWSVATNFPAGTVPMEMVTHDGELLDFRRGGWASVWQGFIH